MDRISPKEVLSMMDAVAQVYEQQGENQVDEAYSQSERQAAQDALSKRAPSTPDYASMSDAEFAELVKKSGNPEGLIAKRKNQQAAAAKNTAPAGAFNISPKGSEKRKELEAQIKRDNAARTDDQRVQPKPATPQEKAYGSRSSLNKDQQAVNREYDRLRKTDPEAAVAYGKKMAARGATNKNFKLEKPTQAQSNPTAAQKQASVDAAIKSVNTPEKVNRQAPAGTALRAQQDKQAAAKSPAARPAATGAATPAVKAPATPAAKPAGSIADRLQQIRDMRARSQSRIAAQGGTPATSAVKAPAPSTTGATTTPTAKPVDQKNKKPLNNGDPMERMTGKGAASLMETYSKVYEEREPQAIDEGIMGALAKVGEVVAEEKTAADPGMKARMGKEAPKKGGYQLPKRTPENAKNVEYYKDDADLFDIIKGHFIEEGLTEEEALVKMFELTEDEKIEILNKTTTEENS
jgi:hypothetical protein